ncbi:MAG TPA: Bax inhibitor-1/YccA family protein [Candidatus Limnocylindrales bacterium]|nr:Bax inhibitor-1/YccA family protein [Candidatus Limnocylindrales bacterium]
MQAQGLPSQLGVRPAPELTNRLLTQSFGWMFAAVLVTAVVAVPVVGSESFLRTAYEYWLMITLATFALGIGVQVAIPKVSAMVGLLLFFIYAAALGVTVGVVSSLYTVESVITSFFGAAAMFGGAAIYGATTKRNLNSIGGFLFMGMIGLLVASVVNIFLGSSPFGWAIALIGVIVFTVYTAYDVQKISYGDYAAALGSMEKASVFGAVHLYVDFINIFLFLLRLFGSRR